MSKDWTQEKAFEVLEGEITRLTAENEAPANDRDGYVQLLTDQNNALTARVAELEGALRAAYEVYAGSDGFIPETAPEGYQQQIIRQMVDCISAALTQPTPMEKT